MSNKNLSLYLKQLIIALNLSEATGLKITQGATFMFVDARGRILLLFTAIDL